VGLEGYPGMRLLLRAGLLCNDARLERADEEGSTTWGIAGDPTEGAFVVAAAKARLLARGTEAGVPPPGRGPVSTRSGSG